MEQHSEEKDEDKGCSLRGIAQCLSASLLLIMAGMTTIFYVYIVELKAIFHYTQIQAEIHSASHLTGKLFILPFAALYGRLQFYGTSLVGYLVFGGGLLLMALATSIPEKFAKLSPVLYIFQFMIEAVAKNQRGKRFHPPSAMSNHVKAVTITEDHRRSPGLNDAKLLMRYN